MAPGAPGSGARSARIELTTRPAQAATPLDQLGRADVERIRGLRDGEAPERSARGEVREAMLTQVRPVLRVIADVLAAHALLRSAHRAFGPRQAHPQRAGFPRCRRN